MHPFSFLRSKLPLCTGSSAHCWEDSPGHPCWAAWQRHQDQVSCPGRSACCLMTANSLLESHEAPLEGQREEMAPPRGPSTLCRLYTKLQSFPHFCSSQSSSLSGVHPSHPHPSSVTSSWVTRQVRAEAGIPGGPSVPMADCQTSLRTFFLQSLGLEPGVRSMELSPEP